MNPKIALLMGSKSDLPKLESCLQTLQALELKYEVRVLSAHRTPEVVAEFARNAESRGLEVIIAAAGGAAHLAGVVAAHTLLPVIGIPVEGGAFKGMDALLSTVQMPGGIAVATVGVGSGGATNAALLAAQILARTDPALRARLEADRASRRDKVLSDDRELQL
jgi:5-(carboxyamino)imidazole ribonucleotide mutase